MGPDMDEDKDQDNLNDDLNDHPRRVPVHGTFTLLAPWTLVRHGQVLPLTWEAMEAAAAAFPDGRISSDNPAWFEAMWAAQTALNWEKEKNEASTSEPRVPRRLPERKRWEATWRYIRPEVERGKTNLQELLAFLAAHGETAHLGTLSEDTLRDILRAGIAGRLS